MMTAVENGTSSTDRDLLLNLLTAGAIINSARKTVGPLYHGTSGSSAMRILREGALRPSVYTGVQSAIGPQAKQPGVYFARDPAVALDYAMNAARRDTELDTKIDLPVLLELKEAPVQRLLHDEDVSWYGGKPTWRDSFILPPVTYYAVYDDLPQSKRHISKAMREFKRAYRKKSGLGTVVVEGEVPVENISRFITGDATMADILSDRLGVPVEPILPRESGYYNRYLEAMNSRGLPWGTSEQLQLSKNLRHDFLDFMREKFLSYVNRVGERELLERLARYGLSKLPLHFR